MRDNKIQVLHLIKTLSYDADGRLQKWIVTLSEQLGALSEVFILEDANQRGETYKGETKITKLALLSRKFFRKRTGYMLKIPEYSLKVLRHLVQSKADVVVFHDLQQYLNVVIGILLNIVSKKRVLIWDLHELPHPSLVKMPLARAYLRYALSRMDMLVYTNEERRKYMLDALRHKEKSYVILNNFPDTSFVNSEKTERTGQLKDWITSQNGKPYLLWMGVAGKSRFFDVVLEVYQNFSDRLNMVIMGKIDEEFKVDLKPYIEKGLIFNKFVRQEDIINYVDGAWFSIVLYNSNTPNNKLCEPNRLYQLLSRDIPVIAGDNPTMANWLRVTKGGITLPDDGRNIESLNYAFERMLVEHDIYKKNLKQIKKGTLFNWELQFKDATKILTNKFEKERGTL